MIRECEYRFWTHSFRYFRNRVSVSLNRWSRGQGAPGSPRLAPWIVTAAHFDEQNLRPGRAAWLGSK